MDDRDEVREFLTSRRATIAPEQAGPASGGSRRAQGRLRSAVASRVGGAVRW